MVRMRSVCFNAMTYCTYKALINTYNTYIIVSIGGLPMTPKQLIKIMKENGWTIKRIKGSHYVMEKEW